MAYHQVSNLAISFHKPENTGKSMEGFFLGTREIKSNKEGMKDFKIHDFIAPDGLPFSLYGFTVLDNTMSGIPKKRLCRITYQGKTDTKTKFGGTGYHKVLVEQDSEAQYPEFDLPALPEAADPF